MKDRKLTPLGTPHSFQVLGLYGVSGCWFMLGLVLKAAAWGGHRFG